MKTKSELDTININKTAIFGKIYVGPNNEYYIGTRQGHLVKEDMLLGDVTGTTLRNKISSVGKYSTEEINELLDIVKNLKPPAEINLYATVWAMQTLNCNC